MNTQTEETKKKLEDFVKEYGELVKKHGVDFATYPTYVPDGQGGFKTIIQSTPVDLSTQPVKSEFMEKE